MISKIELGDGTQFLNVKNIEEKNITTSTETYKQLDIILYNNKEDIKTTSDIIAILKKPNALSSIKAYKQDLLNIDEVRLAAEIQKDLSISIKDITPQYSPEYLTSTFTNYTFIDTVTNSATIGEIYITLKTDTVNLSDEKYNELNKQNEELTLLLASFIGGSL